MTFQHPDGSLHSVPVGWTDLVSADPYVTIAGGRARFRMEDLRTLVALMTSGGPREARGKSDGVTGITSRLS